MDPQDLGGGHERGARHTLSPALTTNLTGLFVCESSSEILTISSARIPWHANVVLLPSLRQSSYQPWSYPLRPVVAGRREGRSVGPKC